MNPQPKTDHIKLGAYAYRKLGFEALERDKCCTGCGSYQNLTLAHKIHRGAGGGHGPGDVISNVHILCISCHDEEERHLNGRSKK